MKGIQRRSRALTRASLALMVLTPFLLYLAGQGDSPALVIAGLAVMALAMLLAIVAG